MGTAGVDHLVKPGRLHPRRQPGEVTVTQQTGRVDLQLLEGGEGLEGVSLYGADGVVVEVEQFEALQAGEGPRRDGLDLVIVQYQLI